MTKTTITPTTPKRGRAPTNHGNSKRGFYLPDVLHERMCNYVSLHRNAPENLTINQFVRDALSAHLDRLEAKRPRAVRA